MGGAEAPGHLHSDHVAGLHCSCFAEYVRPVRRLLGHFSTKTFSEGHGLTPFVSLPPKAGDDAIEDVAASGLLPRKPRISRRFVAHFTSALCTGLGSPGPSAFLNEGLAPETGRASHRALGSCEGQIKFAPRPVLPSLGLQLGASHREPQWTS